MTDTFDWREYDLAEDHTVTGDVRVSEKRSTERLDRDRRRVVART